ncbi:MAG: DUF4091 domain-containing protein [Armatimonadota bacterium]
MRFFVLVAAILTAATASYGVDSLYDFEQEDQATQWRVRIPQQNSLSWIQEFATSGKSALRFEATAWKAGEEQWPGLECNPSVHDWRQYDRLVIDVTNARADCPTFSIAISDSKTSLRQSLVHPFQVPALGFRRFVVPLHWPAAVDASDIHVISLFGERPAQPLCLYLDSIMLLRGGEQPPPPPPAQFRADLAALSLKAANGLQRMLDEQRTQLLAPCASAGQREGVLNHLQKPQAGINECLQLLQTDKLSMAQLEGLSTKLEQLTRKIDKFGNLVELGKANDEFETASSNLLVGLTSSMTKVLPRDMPFDLQVPRSVVIRCARNETESLQVVVTPRAGDLEGVRVSTGHFKSAGGAVLRAANVDCDVVGYVETKVQPAYPISYIGWWPDPILDSQEPIQVNFGDLQAFWIRFRVPNNQPPGLYRGLLKIEAAGEPMRKIPVFLRVLNFALPEHSPLPVAMTLFERPEQMGGWARWAEMKYVYADFLANYYINYDSLYRKGAPDPAMINYLHKKNQLVAYNLGNVFNYGPPAEGYEEALAAAIEELRPGYDRAKADGVLDHAYIYGFDERQSQFFDQLEACAQALREAFPEVPFLTTTFDNTYGQETVATSVDMWCPVTYSYDRARADSARAEGRRVWWYICGWPNSPYANWRIEDPTIATRILMGAQTAKYRPDGFLYYSLNWWNDNQPLSNGPFTDWNPVAWPRYHGDGSLFAFGPEGKPIPSIRLENFRDGLEDYAYACILEEIIRRYEARPRLSPNQRKWLVEAKKTLPVPESLVTSMSGFSKDPAAVYAWRDHMGGLIDRSTMPDANPWGDNFGVRGLDN